MFAMGKFLERLKAGSTVYTIVADGDGFLLVRKDGHTESFNLVVREMLDHGNADFAVFPRINGANYDSAFIIPYSE